MSREGIIYGFHSAEEALKHNPQRINHIWVLKHISPRIQRLLSSVRGKKISIHQVDSRVLSKMAGTQNHQDIVLEISPYEYFRAEDLLSNVHNNSIFCILDEIQDTTNLASIIRSAEGAGAQGIFLPERRTALVTPITSKLSAGALEHIRIARAGNLAQLIDRLHEQNIRVICADASASKLWFQADYSGPIAVLVGNEYKGVRRLLKDKSDEVVKIPMQGKVQSLNVNIATAILLYEAIRQRQTP
jgi:23S rRNA (guanosine2251-2'-O)-methyltransferase